MKEHAIPQDITGYKFHIVGNMTLKQFAEVAIGFVIAFFIYKTNLYFPVKWLLIAFFSSIGAALAFLPIEERPLDHWFITFFTILYKPTKFYWKRKAIIPEPFLYKSDENTKKSEEKIDLSPQRRERITEYLQSVKTTQEEDPEELYYKQRSAQLLSIFDDHSLKIDTSRFEKIKKKPNLKVQVRSLIGVEEEALSTVSETPLILETPVEKNLEIKPAEIVLEKQSIEYEPVEKKLTQSKDVAPEISIPEMENIHVEEVYKNEREAMGNDIAQQNQELEEEQQEAAYVDNLDIDTQESEVESAVVTHNIDLPFPTKPSKPNKLVGMTLTKDNDLINNATITLKDKNNIPVTAVKSNALGQFFISSQLPNGTYNIIVRKEGLTFYPITISLEGKTVDPLEIRSAE
ncbi:MAG: hypothetical protein OEX81_04525 [Candidatus Pacebacteria bacterium]|nr:hypothetical protein [Candidatus Paceibacterota bacterium]